MSAEDLLIVNDMFSEDELTNAMKDNWSANQNKESLTELKEITKQAMQLKKIAADGMCSIINTLEQIDFNSK